MTSENVPKPVDPLNMTGLLEREEHRLSRPMSAVVATKVDDLQAALEKVASLKAAAAAARTSIASPRRCEVRDGAVIRDTGDMSEEALDALKLLQANRVPVIVKVEGDRDFSSVPSESVARSESESETQEEKEEEGGSEASSDDTDSPEASSSMETVCSKPKPKPKPSRRCVYVDDEVGVEDSDELYDDEEGGDECDSQDSFINDASSSEVEESWSESDLVVVKTEGQRRPAVKRKAISVESDGEEERGEKEKENKRKKRERLDNSGKPVVFKQEELIEQRRRFDAFIKGKEVDAYLGEACPKPFGLMLCGMFETLARDDSAIAFPFFADSVPHSKPGFYYYLMDHVRRSMFGILESRGLQRVEGVFKGSMEELRMNCVGLDKEAWTFEFASSVSTHKITVSSAKEKRLVEAYAGLSNFRRRMRLRTLQLVREWADKPGSIADLSTRAVMKNTKFWKGMWHEFKAAVRGK